VPAEEALTFFRRLLAAAYGEPDAQLYNSDGRIFSDAGVPSVLFMENYDLNRSGYHDSQDTVANIDLDYGAALSAIAIEATARAATESPWPTETESDALTGPDAATGIPGMARQEAHCGRHFRSRPAEPAG
jgi:hypothetical protein